MKNPPIARLRLQPKVQQLSMLLLTGGISRVKKQKGLKFTESPYLTLGKELRLFQTHAPVKAG